VSWTSELRQQIIFNQSVVWLLSHAKLITRDFYCVLLVSCAVVYFKFALFITVLWRHASVLTMCWPFSPHCSNVYVRCFYFLIVDVDWL